MNEQWLTSRNLTNSWKESTAIKITAVVLYTVLLVAIVVAAAMLWNADKRLDREFADRADRLAYQLSTGVANGDWTSPDAIAKAAAQRLKELGFSAVEISRDGESVRVGDPGKGSVAIVRSIPTAQGVVVTFYHSPLAEVVQSRRNTVLLVTGMVALVFGLFLNMVILKSITMPIAKLVKATRTAISGDLTVRADGNRQDEFGVLARFFNDMLTQIQNRDRELEQHRRHLEELVVVRTDELEAANTQLRKELLDRRSAEKALQESEKRYRMLFESAGDAIFILEAEGENAGNIVALNKTAADMHGYTVDDLMHKNIQEIDTPDSARNAPQLIHRILGGEWVKNEEMTHRRKNGTVFFVEVSAGLLELGDQKYILAFDRDITKRKIAENLVLHTQQTLQTILSSMPYGVVVIGLDKKIRNANTAALALMGYSLEEQIEGAICNQSFCPTDDDTCPVINLHTTVNQTEQILITKNGEHVPILKTVVPVEIDGEKVLLEAFTDITDQKNAELKLRQYAAELKQSNEDVLSFAYIVSHDLRAPLVSIRGFAGELQYALQGLESVLDRCMPHLSEQERTKLTATYRKDVPVAMDFIKSSVGRMDGLINAVLVLSRLGHRELKPEPINMREVTKLILSSLAHQIEQRKTVVTLGELPTITADKLAMEQIMGNILDNALKYLDPVREGNIAVTTEHNEEEIIFHVSDNGRGIAQEDMHKVFEIFRRAGKQDVPGEGMGLAYVKTLVRKQGGRIWCESEPGKGTTFSFTIPRPAAGPD